MNPKFTPFSLLRKIYQVLLTKGRTYAAFTDRDKEIIKNQYTVKDEILDPMSGFGSVTRFCSQFGIKSYTIEHNLPQYYWQTLNNPKFSQKFISSVERLVSSSSDFPKADVRAIASDEWFPEESKILLFKLLDFVQREIEYEFDEDSDKYSLALLMPFIGRLSCSVAGDNVTHVKKGGICVFRNWESDFQNYLKFVEKYLFDQMAKVNLNAHEVLSGDARTFDFPKRRFTGMYTSPPYPNHRDFNSMFKPENAFLELIGKSEQESDIQHVIGSNFVRGKEIKKPKSQVALNFLDKIDNLTNRKKFQIGHDDVYYLPYLNNYFTDLEDAYRNIEKGLAKKFKGFVVVVDNTHRGIVIPVAETIIEIWKSLGYSVDIYESRELSHVGAKNPRSKGVRALHTEYVIKIWK